MKNPPGPKPGGFCQLARCFQAERRGMPLAPLFLWAEKAFQEGRMVRPAVMLEGKENNSG